VVSVSNDETAAEAGNFAKQVKATFPVLHDPKNTVFGKYGISPMPSNVVVGRKGKVVLSVEAPDIPRIEAAVKKALAAK
jgi:peroxiredoxin